MMSEAPESPSPTETSQPTAAQAEDEASAAPSRSWLKRLVFVMVAVIVVVGGLVWWQERQLSHAAEALARQDTRYAMYLVNRVLQRNPDNARALAIQARCLVELGQHEEAIKIFDRIGAATEQDMHALAKAFMLREEWSSAAPLLVRVLQINPDDSDAWYELTSCQMRLGEYPAALQSAERFAETSGQQARADVLIGSIYGSMRDFGAAAEAFKRILEREPEAKNLQISPAEFYLRYGRTLMELGKPEEALMPLKLSAAGQQTGEVFVLLGDAANQLGRTDHAVTAWKRAVQVDPLNASARASLANAAITAGDGKQSLEWLEPLRDRKLSSAIAYLFQRANTLLGNEEESAKWQARAAELRREENVISALDNSLLSNPNSFWARATKAHYFASEGNWAQAELIVDQLMKEQPGEPFIIELADAVRRKSDLPSLSRIPVKQF